MKCPRCGTTYVFQQHSPIPCPNCDDGRKSDAARQRASMKKLREYYNDKGHDDDLLKDLGLKR